MSVLPQKGNNLATVLIFLQCAYVCLSNNFFQNLQKNIQWLLVFHKAIGWNLILSTISLSSKSNSGIYFLSLNSRTYSFSDSVKTNSFERKYFTSVLAFSKSKCSLRLSTGKSCERICGKRWDWWLCHLSAQEI